jgi:hypothetical protein
MKVSNMKSLCIILGNLEFRPFRVFLFLIKINSWEWDAQVFVENKFKEKQQFFL